MELQDIPYSTPKQTLGNCIPIKLMLWRVTSSNNYQAIAEDGFGKKVIFPSTRILEKEEEIPPDGEWYICENMSDFFMYDTLYLLKPKTSV